jgi:hypothetical protein
MKHNRIGFVLLVMVTVLFVTVSFASANWNANPRVLPPDARVQGMTNAEWSAVWFKETFAIAASEHPGLGEPWTDCFVARVGNIGLSVAFFFTPSEPFVCEMPPGTMLLPNVGAVECSTVEDPPFNGGNEEELRACAQSFGLTVEASIDGVAIENLSDYIVTSPPYELTLPEDNILGVPPGTAESVAHGAFLMLAPLQPGQHTIHTSVTFAGFGVTIEGDYDVTVKP